MSGSHFIVFNAFHICFRSSGMRIALTVGGGLIAGVFVRRASHAAPIHPCIGAGPPFGMLLKWSSLAYRVPSPPSSFLDARGAVGADTLYLPSFIAMSLLSLTTRLPPPLLAVPADLGGTFGAAARSRVMQVSSESWGTPVTAACKEMGIFTRDKPDTFVVAWRMAVAPDPMVHLHAREGNIADPDGKNAAAKGAAFDSTVVECGQADGMAEVPYCLSRLGVDVDDRFCPCGMRVRRIVKNHSTIQKLPNEKRGLPSSRSASHPQQQGTPSATTAARWQGCGRRRDRQQPGGVPPTVHGQMHLEGIDSRRSKGPCVGGASKLGKMDFGRYHVESGGQRPKGLDTHILYTGRDRRHRQAWTCSFGGTGR
ncbi:unnamed protein product [Prorocentrum cordatum]|uniref:Uncharacterized protein n=1 Tax=Prorocentrum cordatum TaxID=2364126 RepID=A0ABN9U0S5_9DINO|nr:unnamed protein product [Polarella glacialis]